MIEFNAGDRCYYAVVGSDYKECVYNKFEYPCFYFHCNDRGDMKVRFEDVHFKKIIRGES